MGSLRRECLDHILIHDDEHLQRVVTEYTAVLATSVIRPNLGGKTSCGGVSCCFR